MQRNRGSKLFGRPYVGTATAVLALGAISGAVANPINDQVAALSEEKRQGLFARMMQREGERCTSINRTFFQGSSSDGSTFWSVACAGGKDWQIMIKNTAQADMKLLECSVIKALNAGQCFTKFRK